MKRAKLMMCDKYLYVQKPDGYWIWITHARLSRIMREQGWTVEPPKKRQRKP